MALGYPHPDYLLPKLTMRQMIEWDSYFKVEPWGHIDNERRHGTLCEIVAASGGVTIGGKPITAKDVVYGAKHEEVILTDEQIERELDRILGV